jgi:hypothetical protein
MAKKLCPICSQMRGVEEHLFELGTMCELLGNESVYNGDDGPSVASLATVGTWLKLGAQLEKVEIDTWKFESSASAMMCRPAADEISSNSSHLSTYSTSFTRFMFTTSALEEMYRFLDHHYLRWANANHVKRKDRARISIRTAILVDQVNSEHWPDHFQHLCASFCKLSERYRQRRGQQLSGMHFTAEGRPSYALHLVRNLRNDIAHGALLPGEHPDYVLDSGGVNDMLHVLSASALITAVYIQLLVKAFNTGFQSDVYRYWQIEAENLEQDDEESFEEPYRADTLLRRCTVNYLCHLHVQNEFAIHKFSV